MAWYDDEEAPRNWWETEEALASNAYSFGEPSYNFGNAGGISSPYLGESVGVQDALDALIPPDLTRYDTPAFGQSTYDFSGNAPSVRGSEFGAQSGSSTIDEMLAAESDSSPSLKGVASALKQLGGGLLDKTQSAGGLLELLALGNALAGYLNPDYKKTQPAGYQGKINMGLKASQPALAQAAREYGEGAKGQAYFGPTTYAAEGGIMGLAKGGQPRYLDGPTDGMSDELDTSIDGVQPAKLSHGEFVIPADVVSHLGNGNSSAGAKVLYKMMDRVRHARTGNKKQGKQIKPEKFMPGGIAAYADGGAVAFATGDLVPGSSVTSNLAEWAGPYVTDYLAKGKALADKPYQAYTGQLTAGAAPLQTQGFAGLAGTTAYQPTAFTSQFQAPSTYKPTAFGDQFAAPGAYQAASFGNQFAAPTSYTPTSFDSRFAAPSAYQTGAFTNQFAAPTSYQAKDFTSQFAAPTAYETGNFASQFAAPAAYQAKDFTSQFAAPGAYQAGQFATGLGSLGSIADYMSPYLQNVTNVQSAEARRQAEIDRVAAAGRLTQAGGYGGSRQAIMESEGARNLQTQIGNIQATGLQSAYDRALAQRLAESKAGVEAQQLGEASRQFGAGQALNAAQLAAQYGMTAQQASEASRQFGAGQAMTGAQEAARYRLADQQAREASRQFGSGQALTAAQLAAQFGMTAQQAAEASRQFGSGQQMTGAQLAAQYGTTAQQAAEASRQFGAGQAMTGAQEAARYRLAEQQAREAAQQFGAGQAMTGAQLGAQYGLAGLQAGEASRQFGAGQALNAAQLEAQYGLAGLQAGEAAQQFGAGQAMNAAQLAAQYGLSAQQAAEASKQFGARQGLDVIGAQLAAGTTQRSIEQQALDAQRAQFEAQRADPYKQIQFQQSLISGLPVAASTASSSTSSMQDLSAMLAALGIGTTKA